MKIINLNVKLSNYRFYYSFLLESNSDSINNNIVNRRLILDSRRYEDSIK